MLPGKLEGVLGKQPRGHHVVVEGVLGLVVGET